ncbi:response regulator transcription factor [Campylobacter hyointestinalis]|uniref:DNA-binding response regulator n=1 Tax=Campylobacter hyointestinalis subsp. hyointestinalis TaxID=91352 RepID=A0A0S4SSZ1_CAMHY|nr:response regulator transcription factor [Campylobacter hyointestinalis]MDL2347006.1 response regulator transcription factor [Campylobacter hyointestinalis]MDL2348381.1 response regulator transcription factor [Campylobacter hyointestinalis]MDL2350493.1 response regulator transcription factor [Campylobacter hyointestinalis]MDM1025958.1 response regulator transcription factor [Campylobacter hyointestinalis]MDM1027133.1 response regulator transcription factor [Campylobacter hyointestinalis]
MNGKMLDKLQTLKVLYAEDEEGIRKNIADSLRYYVKEVFETSNGDEAYRIYQDKAPDIILSDIHMPILNGIELVKKIREQDRKTPIIMITAHIDKKYLMDAVELHMEKYLVKPIDLDILLQTLEKCVSILDINNIVKLEVDKDYSYDFDKKELYYKNKSINLNKKEMLFFEVLIKNQRKITTYEELQSRVWGADIMTDSALRSLVRNLRKKLPTDIIINISGLGYRFA